MPARGANRPPGISLWGHALVGRGLARFGLEPDPLGAEGALDPMGGIPLRRDVGAGLGEFHLADDAHRRNRVRERSRMSAKGIVATA